MKKNTETIVPETWGGFFRDQLKLLPGTLGWSVFVIALSVILGYAFTILRNQALF